MIRCVPGRVDIGSQEQAETRIGDNTVPLRQGDSVGARCGVWSLGMLASMLTPSAVGMPFCADRSTDPTPGIQLGDRHHPVSPPDILGAAGARSSARHPRWLRHKPRCLTRDPVSMRLASTTNAWNLWRQPGHCCGLGLPFNDADGLMGGERALASRILLSLTTRLARLRHPLPTTTAPPQVPPGTPRRVRNPVHNRR